MLLARDGLLVFLGAGLGGVCRWLIGAGTLALFGQTRFPAATFVSNLAACALIGLVAGLALRSGGALGVPARLFLVTGFCGGLSTMSAFGLETVVLLRRGDFFVAGTNVVLTLAVCCGAVWALLRKFESLP